MLEISPTFQERISGYSDCDASELALVAYQPPGAERFS